MLVDETLLDLLLDVVATMSVRISLVDASLDKVIPSEDLLSPQLEAVQEMEISAIGQCQLALAIPDPALDRLVVIVDSRIGDELVDPVHLHGDLFADRDLASDYGVTKRAVILWNGGV